MMKIPELSDMDVMCGDIKHMPKFETLPDKFQDFCNNLYCDAVANWSYSGGNMFLTGVAISGDIFTAKDGVDSTKALRAIKAVLGSWEPKHEHKLAACGFMLSEWFDAEFKKS